MKTDNVKWLHEQMITMNLGDLLLVAGQAVSLPLEDKKIDVILKYVELKLKQRSLERKKS